MKFLAFVDSHEDETLHKQLLQKSQLQEVDFIVCLGDFTWFGNALEKELEFINSLNKKVYLFHGNHEPYTKTKDLCENFGNIEFVHKKIFTKYGVTFVCFGGGGFSEKDSEFETWIKKNDLQLKNAKKIVFATHAPPKNTKLDRIEEDYNVGSKSYRNFITTYKPFLAISGHIHESYKVKDILDTTMLMNPGGDGEIFEVSAD